MSSLDEKHGDLWVFGYGSLMWRPGFPHVERHAARLQGHHRSLCLYSHGYRGTPERPGLVLGLDKGGSCVGVAFRVAPADRDATQAYLTWREGTEVYRETWARLVLVDLREVRALTYVVNRAHPHYAGRLSPPELLTHVLRASGDRGSCRDYVVSTHAHLAGLGVRDARLAWLAERLGLPESAAEPHGEAGMAREVEAAIHPPGGS